MSKTMEPLMSMGEIMVPLMCLLQLSILDLRFRLMLSLKSWYHIDVLAILDLSFWLISILDLYIKSKTKLYHIVYRYFSMLDMPT